MALAQARRVTPRVMVCMSTRIKESQQELTTDNGQPTTHDLLPSFFSRKIPRRRAETSPSFPMNEQIVILDFGSQYTQVIARRIRECNVYSTILRYDTPAKKIAALKPSGLILSGGPASVYAEGAPLPDRAIFNVQIPVLVICYGLPILAHHL